ncbi:dipeptidase [Bartonella tamiae]|uniref:Membrane dipeptidase n=1 Tax=Bartonella tamiae Th239 TaxID=1094558 RepID=J0ZLG6_9HYPH|nr:dipeptidase [Bartonella tamiae]EJF89253.1 hypothetical protein ME5_01804 [Bartonella tamiae Th239]EJF95585.1 hypothetical protein MEG_00075 [Bartonella tamiae Th307]
MTIPCFDGHNDVLLKIWLSENLSVESFIDGHEDLHVDLVKAQKGGLVGGLCAAFPPSLNNHSSSETPQLSHDIARQATFAMADLFKKIECAAPESFQCCKTTQDISAAISNQKFAAVFHIEGAEAISEGLDELYELHNLGLRSLGPVWSRPNIFGHGVPFRFPSSPDIGPGLSEAGKRLIKTCDELGIIIDLSHLNEKGFWDVAKYSQKPLVATHSNAHHICQQSRNLTDKQLHAIRDSDGLVGVNFGVKFLRPDGERIEKTPLKIITDHMRYMVDIMGIDHVAFGSDFNGTTLPYELRDCSLLPNLIITMKEAGFHNDEIEKIALKNFLSLLKRSWND